MSAAITVCVDVKNKPVVQPKKNPAKPKKVGRPLVIIDFEFPNLGEYATPSAPQDGIL